MIPNPVTKTKILPGRATRLRPKGIKPTLIVLHIQEGTNDLSEYFKDKDADCTVWSRIDGELWQLVPDECVPWTNGNLNKPNKSIPIIKDMADHNLYPNNYSLTIEHQGMHVMLRTEKQIQATIKMVAYWCQKWGIPADGNHIIRHADFDSVARPNCPGALFPLDMVISEVAKMLNPYDPNPQNFSIGAGALAILKAHSLVAASSENYYKDAIGQEVSLVYTTDTNFRVMSTHSPANPGGSWVSDLVKVVE